MKRISHIWKVRLEVAAIVALCILGAARPWRNLNRGVGLVSEIRADSTFATDTTYTVEGPALQIVLPQAVVDTLTETIARKDSVRGVMQDSAEKLDKRIHALNREIEQKQKTVEKKQQQLVSLDRLNELLTRQNKQPTQYGHQNP